MHPRQAGGGAGRLGIRRRRVVALYAIAAVVYALDRVTKILAERNLADGPVVLIPNVLELRLTTNPGGAFGLFGGMTWLFVLTSVVVVGAVLWSSRRVSAWPPAVAMGLILAGAIGNLTDRALRGDGFSGEVVDFIDLQVWPVFNVADSAIVLGAAILVVSGVRAGGSDDEEAA